MLKGTKRIAGKGGASVGKLVEVVHQFDEQKTAYNTPDFASVGGASERWGMGWGREMSALGTDNGWVTGVAKKDSCGTMRLFPGTVAYDFKCAGEDAVREDGVGGGECEVLKGPSDIHVVGADEGLEIRGAYQRRKRSGKWRESSRVGESRRWNGVGISVKE